MIPVRILPNTLQYNETSKQDKAFERFSDITKKPTSLNKKKCINKMTKTILNKNI